MCYKVKQPEKMTQTEIEFNARFGRPETFNPGKYLNGFDYPELAIITDNEPSEIVMGKWGLIPGWAAAKDPKEFFKKTNTLNAKIEEVHEKASYKNYTDNRCLILVQSFIEYKHVPIPGRKTVDKVPYEITAPDDKPFAIAGLYSEINGLPTVTLLTTAANTLMAEIHNSAKRMPVVLQKQEQALWLERERLEPYHTRTEVELKALPIAKGTF